MSIVAVDDALEPDLPMDVSESSIASLARVFSSDGRPWRELLDDAAAIIGKVAGGMCLIGVGVSGSTVFDPVGVYNDEPERLVRINGTPGFVWPVSRRASRVLASGESFRGDGSMDSSGHRESGSLTPWQGALQEPGQLAHMMLAIQFAGASVGMVVVARRPPGAAYTEADARDLEGPVDVLAVALRALSVPPNHGPAADHVPQVSRSNVATLSGREREVLVLLAQGLTSAEIGGAMFLSTRTVEWYRARILQKLDHPTRAELVALGREFDAA